MMGGDEILDKLLQLLPDNDVSTMISCQSSSTIFRVSPVHLQQGLADWNTYGHLEMENFVRL